MKKYKIMIMQQKVANSNYKTSLHVKLLLIYKQLFATSVNNPTINFAVFQVHLRVWCIEGRNVKPFGRWTLHGEQHQKELL